MTIRRYALAACLAGALLIPAIAAADPILIRWGHLGVSVEGLAQFRGEMELAGTRGFLPPDPDVPIFTLLGFGGLGRVDAAECISDPCPPGTSISLGAAWIEIGGTAILDGRTFRLGPVGHEEDVAGAFVEFSGTAIAPPFDGGMTAITAPFRFGGSLFSPIGTESLTGGGVATLWLNRVPPHDGFPDSWVVTRARYEFVDPIPEPGTLLLLGGGLVGLAGRAYRRRRLAQPA